MDYATSSLGPFQANSSIPTRTGSVTVLLNAGALSVGEMGGRRSRSQNAGRGNPFEVFYAPPWRRIPCIQSRCNCLLSNFISVKGFDVVKCKIALSGRRNECNRAEQRKLEQL